MFVCEILHVFAYFGEFVYIAYLIQI